MSRPRCVWCSGRRSVWAMLWVGFCGLRSWSCGLQLPKLTVWRRVLGGNQIQKTIAINSNPEFNWLNGLPIDSVMLAPKIPCQHCVGQSPD